MSAQKWVIFTVSALIFVVILFLLNVIVAGVLFLITMLFEPTEATIVFKWVLIGLSILDFPITIYAMYESVKKKGGKESGT